MLRIMGVDAKNASLLLNDVIIKLNLFNDSVPVSVSNSRPREEGEKREETNKKKKKEGV